MSSGRGGVGGHRPVVDPGAEGGEGHAGLADAAAGEGLGEAVGGGGGGGGVGHPNLRALPAGALAAGSGGLAEEGPLGAVGGAVGAGQVGGDVPPFEAEGRVGAVVAGEGDVGGGGDFGEACGLLVEAGVALGEGGGGEEEKEGGEGSAKRLASLAEASAGRSAL